jgi:excisionase family DNA binding protein
MDEPLIGPTDVARMLGTPTSWVYMKSEAGELPSYKLGHYRRFKRSEIEEYLRACRSTPNRR